MQILYSHEKGGVKGRGGGALETTNVAFKVDISRVMFPVMNRYLNMYMASCFFTFALR